jgi:hypothetical protein
MEKEMSRVTEEGKEDLVRTAMIEFIKQFEVDVFDAGPDSTAVTFHFRPEKEVGDGTFFATVVVGPDSCEVEDYCAEVPRIVEDDTLFLITEEMEKCDWTNIRVRNTEFVDDPGNEYLYLIRATMLNDDGEPMDIDTLLEKANLMVDRLNQGALDGKGDFIETAESPIVMNCTVIFPITMCK